MTDTEATIICPSRQPTCTLQKETTLQRVNSGVSGMSDRMASVEKKIETFANALKDLSETLTEIKEAQECTTDQLVKLFEASNKPKPRAPAKTVAKAP